MKTKIHPRIGFYFSISVSLLFLTFSTLEGHASEMSSCERLSRLDPLLDDGWRDDLTGAHRVESCGIQIHPHCLTLMKEEWGDESVGFLIERFDSAMKETASRMLGCRVHYPELGPYFHQWISQFRRSVMTCSKNISKKYSADGINLAIFKGSERFILSEEERAGFGWKGNWNGYRNYQTNFVISDSALVSFLDQSEGGIGIVIHEIFHSTGLNNSLHLAEPKEKEEPFCSKEGDFFDRVSLVSELCAAGTSQGRGLLEKKILGCGKEECQKVFTSEILPKWTKGTPARFWLNPDLSFGLSENEASSLCSGFSSNLLCGAVRSNLSKLLFASPEVKALEDRIKEKLLEYEKRNDYEIRASLLSLFPEQVRELKMNLDDACVASAFKLDESQNLRIFPYHEPAANGPRKFLEMMLKSSKTANQFFKSVAGSLFQRDALTFSFSYSGIEAGLRRLRVSELQFLRQSRCSDERIQTFTDDLTTLVVSLNQADMDLRSLSVGGADLSALSRAQQSRFILDGETVKKVLGETLLRDVKGKLEKINRASENLKAASCDTTQESFQEVEALIEAIKWENAWIDLKEPDAYQLRSKAR
jgi:hypothetical protein